MEAETTKMFRPYDHLERIGHPEVEAIDAGKVYVFPKLDGTNASVWLANDGAVDVKGKVQLECGSRRRHLVEGSDNHGFRAWCMEDEVRHKLSLALWKNLPAGARLYGEWLVPHSLKTYREEAWRRFWIFDVWVPDDTEAGHYLDWEDYSVRLADCGLDLIMPLCVVDNPAPAQLQQFVEQNTFLIQDGAGVGEGVVLKNYAWRNNYGRQPWAKIVRNAFKEQNAEAFGVRKVKGATVVEFEIAVDVVTPELVGKTRAKVVAAIAEKHGIDLMDPNAQQKVEIGFRGKVIPQLLSRVYHDVVIEELWPQLKKRKNPTIDFGLLNRHVTLRVKGIAADLFA